MSAIIKIDDAMMAELQKIWREKGCQIYLIFNKIREMLEMDPYGPMERLLLYGQADEKGRVFEHLFGWLYSVAPGIVGLDGELNDSRLSGLLERNPSADGKCLFRLLPLADSFAASLYIRPSTWPQRKTQKFQICPVYIDYNIGAGQGESYGEFGIDPIRWAILERWLDRYLLKPETQTATA